MILAQECECILRNGYMVNVMLWIFYHDFLNGQKICRDTSPKKLCRKQTNKHGAGGIINVIHHQGISNSMYNQVPLQAE